MVRASSIVLGAGLVILWAVGLGNHATAWLTWLNGLGALCAFGIAAAIVPNMTLSGRVSPPIVLSIGLFVLWIIALATHAEAWLAWWTFAFACAFLLVGIIASFEHREPMITRPRTV